jgi:hypothetical protein
LPGDVPPKESSLHPLYLEVFRLYEKLFSFGNNCLICGVVKDSRARRISKLNCSDSLLCSYLLEESERTEAVDYFPGQPPPDMPLQDKINVFYMRPAKNDLPLRIEVLGEKVDKAASILCSLSAISEHFAYPAILIEADMCAALNPNEMKAIEETLQALSGLRPLRRNFRPFR